MQGDREDLHAEVFATGCTLGRFGDELVELSPSMRAWVETPVEELTAAIRREIAASNRHHVRILAASEGVE